MSQELVIVPIHSHLTANSNNVHKVNFMVLGQKDYCYIIIKGLVIVVISSNSSHL